MKLVRMLLTLLGFMLILYSSMPTFGEAFTYDRDAGVEAVQSVHPPLQPPLATTGVLDGAGLIPVPEEIQPGFPVEEQAVIEAPIGDWYEPGIVPVALEIPAIRLESEIVEVGLLDNGAMDVPDDFDTVGWFSPGYRPGRPGNAALAGHVDHYTGPAVFFDLRRLSPGDPVYITSADGVKLEYQVVSVESFLTAEAPLERIFGAADYAGLNLITCSGVFNRRTQEHSHRLVVFTQLVSYTVPPEVS